MQSWLGRHLAGDAVSEIDIVIRAIGDTHDPIAARLVSGAWLALSDEPDASAAVLARRAYESLPGEMRTRALRLVSNVPGFSTSRTPMTRNGSNIVGPVRRREQFGDYSIVTDANGYRIVVTDD